MDMGMNVNMYTYSLSTCICMSVGNQGQASPAASDNHLSRGN